MAKGTWLIKGTEVTAEAGQFRSLNLTRNKQHPGYDIVYVDEEGTLHEDINSPDDLKKLEGPPDKGGRPAPIVGGEEVIIEDGQILVLIRGYYPVSVLDFYVKLRRENKIAYPNVVSFLAAYAEYGAAMHTGLAPALIEVEGTDRNDLLQELKEKLAVLEGNMKTLNLNKVEVKNG